MWYIAERKKVGFKTDERHDILPPPPPPPPLIASRKTDISIPPIK